jgi:hypothetical protein
MMYMKEVVTITVTTKGGYGDAVTMPVNLDWWMDRERIISYRRDGCKVVVNRHLFDDVRDGEDYDL